jgi:hypothetical protein
MRTQTATVSGSATGTTGTGSNTTVATGPYRWGNVALGGGGFVSAVIASPTEKNLFYARTDVGGMYRWNEAGQSWVPLLDWVSEGETGYLGVEAVAVDPQEAGKVYALVGTSYFNGGKTAILRSSDYGATFQITDVTNQWAAHGNGMGRQNGERLAVDPNLGSVLFCGTRSKGLFRSTDSGATWTRVAGFPVTTTPNDNGVAFVLFDKSSGSAGKATPRLFAGVSRMGDTNLYVSSDGGTTWNGVAGANTTYMPARAVLAKNGMLYVTYGNGAGPSGNSSGSEPTDKGAIWRYDLAGSAWKDVTPSGLAHAFSGISADATNPNVVVATTINTYMAQPWGWGDRIVFSTDGGTTWTDIFGSTKATMDVNGMPWIANRALHWAGCATIDPFNPERVFVTSGNGIFATSNLTAAASTWKFMVRGLEETVPLEAVSIPGGKFVSVIGDYDGAAQSDVTVSPPAGIHNPSMGTTSGLAYAGAASSVIVRAGDKLYRSADGGTSWTEITRPTADTHGNVALSADGAVLLWTPSSASTTRRYANGTWSTASGINFNTVPVGDPVNANKFYAYNPSAGTLWASSNGGASFAQVSSPGAGGADKIRAVPGVEGDIWVPLNNGGLTRSTNSGSAFNKLTAVQSCSAVGFGKAAAGKTFPTVFIWGRAGNGPTGIYRSTDAGATWDRINDDAHEFGGVGNGHFVVGDMNVVGRVYMGTVGRGIVYGDPA